MPCKDCLTVHGSDWKELSPDAKDSVPTVLLKHKRLAVKSLYAYSNLLHGRVGSNLIFEREMIGLAPSREEAEKSAGLTAIVSSAGYINKKVSSLREFVGVEFPALRMDEWFSIMMMGRDSSDREFEHDAPSPHLNPPCNYLKSTTS